MNLQLSFLYCNILVNPTFLYYYAKLCHKSFRGAGGLHQDFLEIDFLVVNSYQKLFYQIKKYCSYPEILLVKGQCCSVIVLRARFTKTTLNNKVVESKDLIDTK